ncbi:MAG: FAD-dependent oxidoreductase [Proteobacteria bacterium]|nr:FAD-dependent oxidoreductase [Pseudomonadota bacterium]
MDKKKACYICTGCGIGEVIKVDGLANVAKKEYKIENCKSHEFLCSPEGVGMIKADIESEGFNTVVIAACSPRVMYDVFDFGNIILDRVNLREQVVWCTEPNDELDDENEDRQMMAEDYLRMGLSKVGKMELPVPYLGPDGEATQFSKDILVVGGGVAGMTAALEAAKAGYGVALLEKEAALGGFSAKLAKSTPSKPPYQDLEETGVPELIAEVQGHDRIKVYPSAEIVEIKGGPGLFDTEFKSDGQAVTQRFGAIVQATGWKPYNPEKLGHLGYGASPDVITNIQFEEMASAGKIARPSDGGEPAAVAFIQCAGSRDQEHLPYCSAVCCRASLKHAIMLKQQNEEMAVYIIYKDLRAPGQDEEFYRQAQRAGVVFIRGDVEKVEAGGGKIVIEAEERLLNDKVQIDELDLVVLATGMMPNAATWLIDPDAVATAEEEKKPAEGEEEAVKPKVRNSVLKLAYRQGPDLPNLKYGFPDSHFICFPYETRRTGVYTAGTVRRPMTMSSAKEDATGAAMKAIQAVEAVAVGKALHPRAGDLSFPEIYLSRCTQCRRCTDECPFGALNEDEKSNPLPQPTRCRRCGVCMGACPERIISFKNYSVDLIGSMIKDVEIPEEDEEKPRVLIFACENDAYPALDMAGAAGLKYSAYVRIIPLRCLGSMNLVWIADALSTGYDGVMLLGCRPGDDYQCHFVKGSELATVRMSKIAETLTRLALEPERVQVDEVSITDWDRLPRIIGDFMEVIDRVGPNPFKDL